MSTRFIDLYEKIYRILEYGGGEETIGYDKIGKPLVMRSTSGDTIWDYGVTVGNFEYTINTLQDMRTESEKRVVPRNFAELFAGEFDIVRAIADTIERDYDTLRIFAN